MIVSEKKISLNLNKYDVIDQSLITSKNFVRNFGSQEDYVEAHLYTASDVIIYSNYDYKDYRLPGDLKPSGEVTNTNSLIFSPGQQIESLGYVAGVYKVVYNILRKKIVNTNQKVFFIKEISPDRKELRVSSNSISNLDIQNGTINFINEIQSSAYYKDYLLNFGNNKLINCVNIALDINTNPYSILVKLYKPLPEEFVEKDSFWFVEELSDPITFEVEIAPKIVQIADPFLRSANFSIKIDDKSNKISEYYNYTDILSNESLFSYQRLLNKLKDRGIEINVNYSEYSDFVHFSSAARRLLNFIDKVERIEYYNQSIDNIKLSPSYSISVNLSQSVYDITNKINDIYTNFDGYENYMYYESSSQTWPKSNSTKPYVLYPSTSSEALNWIGSLDYTSPYYGGQIYTASAYDQENPNNLVYSIPEYIRIDTVNEQYDRFVEMIGQHFDNIWLYIKSIGDLYKATNNLNTGISKDLVYYSLKSLGVKIYDSKANDDLYNYLIGSTVSGSYIVSSSNNNTLISASSEIIPGQDIQKEVLKRLYHNLPGLLKKKGTRDGIDDLISIFGVPSTILSANQFGGADKNSITVEYTYDRFSYGLYKSGSSSVSIPWNSLYATVSGSYESYVPDSIELRFKPNKESYYSTASIIEAITTGSNTRNFGVIIRPNLSIGYPYSNIDFYLYGSSGVNSASISLPIYYTDVTGEEQWWNILLKREYHKSLSQISDNQKYTIVVANKIDTIIGHQASSSIDIIGAASSSYNTSWSTPNQTIYLGGSGLTTYNDFYSTYLYNGQLQEYRYWSTPISQSTFFTHVLNPESIQSNTSGSSYSDLVARFTLGNNLAVYNHSITTEVPSTHPNYQNRIFYLSSINQSASFSGFSNNINYLPNIEEYVTTSPNSVYANPVNQKIRIHNNSITGSVLSPFLRLEDQSEVYLTKDVHYNDISFSPQNEINKDIISNYGNTIDIDERIGNPKESFLTNYPTLDKLSEEYYKKYINRYNLKDYVKLIQYIDNSLFRVIEDYVPARDNLYTGLTIKSPILERPKAKTPQGSGDSEYNNISVAITSSKIEADSIYKSGVGDGRDFYTGELEGTILNVHEVFVTKNTNPYL
jgi:hypothetical protein